MAKFEETIFNLGSSHLSAWKVLRKDDKLFLDSFEHTDLPATNGDEDAWISEVEVALLGPVSRKRLKGRSQFHTTWKCSPIQNIKSAKGRIGKAKESCCI